MPLPENPEVQEKLRRLKELENAERQVMEVKEDKKLRQAEWGFGAFCEAVMRDEKTDEPIKLSPIHKSWVNHITMCWSKGLHSCILAPFGHGKTAIFGVALPLWLFGIDPTLRIKIFCANDKLAKQRLGLVRQYIEESDEYHEVFPYIKPHPNKPWSAHELYLDRRTKAKDASLECYGAMATAIGGRGDINLFDDLNDAKNTLIEPKRREQVNQNYRAVFMSRLDPDSGHASMIATRWHDKDAFGQILADPEMRANYGILVQRINEEFTGIDCEYLIGDPKEYKGKSKLEVLLHKYSMGEFHVPEAEARPEQPNL